MKPPPFDYAAPTSVPEAVQLLDQHPGDGRVLAGGQSLVPLLNMRLARPTLIVDLNRIPELARLHASNGALFVGAMARKSALEHSALVGERQPLLHEATRWIAHPQIRSRGTFGGSLAHADPAAEYPAVALALEAELHVAGPQGERVIPAKDFFVSYLATALEPNEILTGIRIPAMTPGTGWSIREVARRRGDFAMAGVVALVDLDAERRCARTRIVLFGVGATPLRARRAEGELSGREPTQAVLDRAAHAASDDAEAPLSDVHASAAYRRHLAGVLTRRALAEAVTRCALTEEGQ